MKTKYYIEIEIEAGENVLVENTPETERLIKEEIALEDLIDSLTFLLKKSKFGTKEFLEETHDVRDGLVNQIGEATTELTLARDKLKDKIYIHEEAMGFEYDVRLNSNEEVLLSNLLMLNIADVRGKGIPAEGIFREDLLEKVHPANHRMKSGD